MGTPINNTDVFDDFGLDLTLSRFEVAHSIS